MQLGDSVWQHFDHHISLAPHAHPNFQLFVDLAQLDPQTFDKYEEYARE
jgi:hypothetical protein